jgi:hypothetical protein
MFLNFLARKKFMNPCKVATDTVTVATAELSLSESPVELIEAVLTSAVALASSAALKTLNIVTIAWID